MRHLTAYRALTRLLPHRVKELTALSQQMSTDRKNRFRSVLSRHRALGGALALFNAEGITDHFVYGAATADTAFRLASVSKLVTAAGVMAMAQQGLVDLEADADANLGFSLRHPKAKDTPITLRMLLTHTSSIIDSPAYFKALGGGKIAEDILQAGSHADYLPGQQAEYSNFAFGLIASVVEAQTGMSFETAMRQSLFAPLDMAASYYPALLEAPLADARRVLPPQKAPNFSGQARKNAGADGWDVPSPQTHYLLAQGNACMDVKSLVKLGQALLTPGFFTPETLADMTRPHASLHSRDPHLRQGLGIFLLDDNSLCGRTLYGHQGMAYGAVHMLFLDLDKKRGILSLTTGASEARRHILTDLNRALLKEWCEND